MRPLMIGSPGRLLLRVHAQTQQNCRHGQRIKVDSQCRLALGCNRLQRTVAVGFHASLSHSHQCTRLFSSGHDTEKATSNGGATGGKSSNAHVPDLQDRYITVPNALTVIRMGLGPYVSYALLTGQPVAAFDAFVVAGALDGIDGWIARKFNQSSIIGSYLDPLADKVLIACAAGALTWLGVVPWWATLVMVGRDAGLVAGGLWHRVKTKPAGVGFFSTSHSDTLVVEPSGLSKFNTGMQLLCFTSALTHVAFGMPGAEAVTGMAAVATATTVASGYGYWKKLPFAARKRGASTGEHEQ